jgi:hypothetical protein
MQQRLRASPAATVKSRFAEKRGTAVVTSFSEPTLVELLNDPVTRAVMQADGVNPWKLEEMLHGVARLRRVPGRARLLRR